MKFPHAPIALGVWLSAAAVLPAAVTMDWIRVSPDGRGFVGQASGAPFTPWGFNYDHDRTGRLIEDYWDAEWKTVEEDFHEMKELGANVVRVHLQFGKFMVSAEEANTNALAKLDQLVALATQTGLHLNLTGLGCYHKAAVPAWYEALDEPMRWKAQAKFWEAVAARVAESPAVFCLDLMNEPVAPGGTGKRDDWLGPPFGGKHFVQVITREPAGRSAPDIARAWIHQLVAAIRKHDTRHLITVGLVDWSLDRPGLRSGFVPEKIAPELDFLCVHLYPKKGEVPKGLETLRGFAVGKPVVIEETFPLSSTMLEFEEFMRGSRETAAGWVGFYWGKTPVELRRSKELSDAFLLSWLEFFQRETKTFRK